MFKFYKLILALSVGLVILQGCNSDAQEKQNLDENSTSSEKIKIFKFDESIQCESEGLSLNEMSFELINSNITVYCSQKNHDGFSRTAVCGASTGSINVYLINLDDLNASQSLGFRSVDELVAYTDLACE